MPRKDIENVLRNLYCFLEILQTSRSEEVSTWDKQSLHNALKWAAFAEQAMMIMSCANEGSARWMDLLLAQPSVDRATIDRFDLAEMQH